MSGKLVVRNVRKRGFTLIELMIIVAIIGILVAILIPVIMQLMTSGAITWASALPFLVFAGFFVAGYINASSLESGVDAVRKTYRNNQGAKESGPRARANGTAPEKEKYSILAVLEIVATVVFMVIVGFALGIEALLGALALVVGWLIIFNANRSVWRWALVIGYLLVVGYLVWIYTIPAVLAAYGAAKVVQS